MLFNSINFLFFFPIVVVIYFAIPKKYRYMWLLVASYYFYMNWNAKYALLLLASTAITYICGYMIGSVKPDQGMILKKFWVAICLISNLAILGVFKYFDFFVRNINSILRCFHLQVWEPGIDIILPVGISFYTFQALSYTIDVYRGTIAPEKSFTKYALFVSFFPQLVAGPIERSKNLLRQIQDGTDFDYQRAKDGLLLMLWGFFEKLLIADRAAVIVNEVYENYERYPGSMIIFATFLFAFQIYGDFSGYSHIAIGAAKVLGYGLMDNFRQPYFAVSIKEFWRRWHISLSTWFQDYLYIPLGGSKCSKWKKYRNLMITFLVSGLWHGASWSFVVWGGMHGIYRVFGEISEKLRRKFQELLRINTNCFSYHLFQQIITFVLVDAAWFFFRANGLRRAAGMLKIILTDVNIPMALNGKLYKLGLEKEKLIWLLIFIILLLFVDMLHEKEISIRKFLEKQNIVFRWLCYFTMVFVLLLGVLQDYGSSAANFIYFQF